MERRRVVASGLVQGVWFRETVRRAAERHGVAGWVRNNPDGTVEAVFEGDAEGVDRLVEVARLGPPGARVDRLDVTVEQPDGAAGFRVVG
jgi:acylphosphatase